MRHVSWGHGFSSKILALGAGFCPPLSKSYLRTLILSEWLNISAFAIDTDDPESTMISVSTPAICPLMSTVLVLIDATVTVLLKGLVNCGGVCCSAQMPHFYFPDVIPLPDDRESRTQSNTDCILLLCGSGNCAVGVQFDCT